MLVDELLGRQLLCQGLKYETLSEPRQHNTQRCRGAQLHPQRPVSEKQWYPLHSRVHGKVAYKSPGRDTQYRRNDAFLFVHNIWRDRGNTYTHHTDNDLYRENAVLTLEHSAQGSSLKKAISSNTTLSTLMLSITKSTTNALCLIRSYLTSFYNLQFRLIPLCLL